MGRCRSPGKEAWRERLGTKGYCHLDLEKSTARKVSTGDFYGKIKGGLAVLMSMDYLRERHYPEYHRPLRDCSPLARRLYEIIRMDPIMTGRLREEMNMTKRPERSQFDRALKELQITLNIARRNSANDESDTWVPFTEQYLEISLSVR
jgi:hypothetical protein